MREEVLAILAEHVDLPADPAAPLELTSLELVVLAEALEEKFGFTVAARELTPENFGSVNSIVAFVEKKT